MYGFGNWTEVSEHVGTKSKSQCIDHYNAVYMDSPCFPLPVRLIFACICTCMHPKQLKWYQHPVVYFTQDMSHVMGKTREELLAMARGNVEMKKGQLEIDLSTLQLCHMWIGWLLFLQFNTNSQLKSQVADLSLFNSSVTYLLMNSVEAKPRTC